MCPYVKYRGNGFSIPAIIVKALKNFEIIPQKLHFSVPYYSIIPEELTFFLNFWNFLWNYTFASSFLSCLVLCCLIYLFFCITKYVFFLFATCGFCHPKNFSKKHLKMKLKDYTIEILYGIFFLHFIEHNMLLSILDRSDWSRVSIGKFKEI